MSEEKLKNDRGPLRLEVKASIGDRILRRCHDEGVNANEATELLWERQLRRPGSIVGEDTDALPPASLPPSDEPGRDNEQEESDAT